MLCMRKPNPNKLISRELDMFLRNEERKEKRKQKILLLGTGESGKTTILKQMKIIHLEGFSVEERKKEIRNIKQNIHESIYVLVNNMNKINPQIEFGDESSRLSAEYILDIGEQEEYNDEFFDHIETLWKDKAIREMMNHSHKFQLLDNASYFLDKISVIRKEDYIPSVEDILHCRVKTVGITKIEFHVPYQRKNVHFSMFDVGGQRGERRKWLSVFEGVTAILFVIAMNDFDLTLREDNERNRLKEAFKVFEDVFWSRFLRTSGKILFLNKQDLLKEKIEKGYCIGDNFPEYNSFGRTTKYKTEYDKATAFLKDEILKISKNKPSPENIECMPGIQVEEEVPDQDIYIHFTIATDTNNIKLVFDSVKDIVLTNNLITTGIY